MSEAGPRRGPSLFPREHGAYAQLAFPLLTALALGDLGPAPLLVLAAVVGTFLLHEPLLVLIGGRGGRARRELAHRARRRGALLAALALPAGAVGLAMAAPVALVGALVPVTFGVLLIPLIFSRREKTALGELLVAFALATTMIPVALAGGVTPRVAGIASGIWMVTFALATITVRSIIAGAKRGATSGLAAIVAPLLCAAAMTAALLLAVTDRLPALAAVAVVPTALVALIFSALGIHPRNLRRMGWSLVASNIAALAALIAGLR